MDSRGAVLAALGANLAIAAAKAAAFAVTGSSALLSEAIHSLADSTNQALLLVGNRHANTAASRAHPFGKAAARYLYGFVVSIILFMLGGVFSIYEGVHKVQHPEALTSPWVAYAVLGFAMTAEAYALRTALAHTRSGRAQYGFFGFIRRTRDPEYPVLLLEDSGALLGLLIATIAVTVSVVTGNGVWDGVGSILIGVLLVMAAIVLATETGSLLIGESADPSEQTAIMTAVPDGVVITGLIHIRTLHLGPQSLLVAVKVAVAAGVTIERLAPAIDAAEQRIRAAVPDAVYIFIEPDLMRDGGVADPQLFPADTTDQ